MPSSLPPAPAWLARLCARRPPPLPATVLHPARACQLPGRIAPRRGRANQAKASFSMRKCIYQKGDKVGQESGNIMADIICTYTARTRRSSPR